MGLAGEAVVATRWLEPFAERDGGHQEAPRRTVGHARSTGGVARGRRVAERVAEALNEAQSQLERTRAEVTERIASVEQFSLRQETLAARLYREVLATRMRPFGELVEGFPRLVRDLARQLGKKVRLQIDGEKTDVDRDIGALLDAPLNHVVRNAVDHGIETPADRVAAGKPEIATIRMSAWHRSGMLMVEVADDGRGVDLARLRQKVIERGPDGRGTAEKLSEQELLEFLFLPGFTTAEKVTDISGRGVGLDVVLETMKTVGGRARIGNRPGLGPVDHLRAAGVTVRAAGAHRRGRRRTVRVSADTARPCRHGRTRGDPDHRGTSVHQRAGRAREATRAGVDDARPEGGRRHVGLATARQILGVPGEGQTGDRLAVVMLSRGDHDYGIVVDRIVGEEIVVVRPLDPRLGKVPGVSAAALSFDGSPLLVLDVDDMLRAVEQILATGSLARVGGGRAAGGAHRKRVLVVDDSITVREVERQTLEAHGYLVEVAVDGMDGWNAIRTGHYDLMVTDVDMPRMDGIELVRRVRADQRFRGLPIIIVSYKDREEDRLRGLDAGASYYLPKAAFHDESFVQAVDELIGSAEA